MIDGRDEIDVLIPTRIRPVDFGTTLAGLASRLDRVFVRVVVFGRCDDTSCSTPAVLHRLGDSAARLVERRTPPSAFQLIRVVDTPL